MKQHRVFTISNKWSNQGLRRDVEQEINKLSKEGFEIVSVSFSYSFLWRIPTAYITVFRTIL